MTGLPWRAYSAIVRIADRVATGKQGSGDAGALSRIAARECPDDPALVPDLLADAVAYLRAGCRYDRDRRRWFDPGEELPCHRPPNPGFGPAWALARLQLLAKATAPGEPSDEAIAAELLRDRDLRGLSGDDRWTSPATIRRRGHRQKKVTRPKSSYPFCPANPV